MWLIVLIIFIVIVVLLVVLVSVRANIHNKGDYKDGGGKQFGGSENAKFFIPNNERAGIYGERQVNYYLRPLLRADEYLLANLLLPLRNGYKTEIDCVLISRKGIFCVETKNWVGHISGSDEDDYWKQEYDDPAMNDRYHENPITQNRKHCEVLERTLKNKYGVTNIVVFANLEDGWRINSDYAYTIEGYRRYYRQLDDEELSEDEVTHIFNSLKPYIATSEQLEEHRRNVKRERNKFDNRA